MHFTFSVQCATIPQRHFRGSMLYRATIAAVFTLMIGLFAQERTPTGSATKQTTAPRAAASDSMAEMPEVLVAPLFIETGEFTSTITMVNELNFAVTANVIVRNSQGAQIASQLVNFTAHSQQALMVADVLRSSNSAESVGSVEILPDPAQVVSMAIAAQISITGSGGSAGQHIEEEFLMAGTQGSGILRSAGTSLTGQPIVAIKNASPASQTATISCITEKDGATQQ